ncbi:unnamed protein product [Heligmosomoides polygyrus]|uniref:Integrase_H2C2 domain-containing protein n=1 Tax=Heligmosomoides polygyrus TaxID=6339 RepID=A0A183FB47_HELPZ|nr:unnamed protein product [Heligmosomoides polygyrus]
MESQFNKQYGTRKRCFARGDAVLVRVYNGKHSYWCNGEVLQRVGRVLYKVLVGDTPWIRHANQLRKRAYDSTHMPHQDLDVLFEMFDLKRSPSAPPLQPTPISTEQHVRHQAQPGNDEDQPRRSTRTRRPTRRLHMDPHQKSYV